MIRTHNRVALYARFSSDNQRSESIDAQVRAMTAYCKQHKFTIVETYIDEAKSATTDRRPSFQQMIADSAYHQFDIVLVHKLDRFARNRYDSAVYKRELKKNGVTVYSVLENLDDSPESIMMESVLEGMSEYYSQNLAREVMKGMRETALQGKHTGGRPPYGYDVDAATRKLIVNPQEAEAVQHIFKMYAEGYGYSYILQFLHQRGYRTKRGGEFMKNILYSILTNPKYQGLFVFNRSSAKSIRGTRNTHLLKEEEDIITIDGGCPQIVDEDTFSRVQQRIDTHRHTGGRANAKHNYLLSGKVFCKECGRAMVGNARRTGSSKALYVTYRCPSKRYNCTNKEINKNYLEAYVIDLMEQHVFNVTSMKRLAKRIETLSEKGADAVSCEIAAIETNVTKVTNAITNITEILMAGMASPTLTAKLTELEQEKAQLDIILLKLKSRQMTLGNAVVDPQLIPQEYSRLSGIPSSPAYKNFLQSFIERIDVGRYGVDIILKTGLDIFPSLDTTISARRQEIYEKK